MADYYPLIARAIAGLDPSAPGESRRALYERARAALIAQLRSVQPPLSESEITRERLSLEEAVRKVESEAAQRARDATRPGGDGARGARAGDAFRATTRPGARPGEASPPPSVAAVPQRRGRRPPRSSATTVRRSARKTGQPRARPAPAAQPPRRSATAAVATAAAPDRTGSAAAADPRAHRRAAPRPRQQPPQAAGAGHARLPRHRRRCRRSRPRRRAGQPRRAKNLCQRAVAVAGVRPARAEHGEPRRRSRRALFV